MHPADRWNILVLALVIASLLLVGIVSGTVVRHLLQVVPATILMIVRLRYQSSWWAASALAIHLFWSVIMVMIWLFLAGVAHVVTGRFTPAEVVLTGTIGVASIFGCALAVRNLRLTSWRASVTAFLIAAVTQIAAMWVSLQPAMATR